MKWILSIISLLVCITVNAFPINITHHYGTLTLDKQPLRVISVGVSDQDDILSFGVKPLAIRDWYGEQPYGVWPWAQEKLGDAKPLLMKGRSLDYEAIAGLKPDLIIGITSGMTQKEFAKLNAIAPTLARPKGYADWMVPWNIRHQAIGDALGFSALAMKNIQDLQQKIVKTKADHPEFAMKTAAVAFYYNKQPGAYTSKDLRSQFLISLGFVIPSEIDALATNAFYASFSEERLDLLNNDIVVWLASKETIEQASTAAFRTRMPFYKQHREYFTGDMIGGAFSFFSPLSIQFLLDEIVPGMSSVIKNESK